MNFEDFFGGGFHHGGGGFPGGGGMGGMRQPKGDTTILYKTLGVDTKASQNEIKKAYRKLAMKHHPDRGGDVEEFKKIQGAYDCLSDEDKRKAYDATGDPNADPRMVQGRRKRKGKNTQFELEVPMEQFFKGHTRKIRVTKTVLCKPCDGKGGHGVTNCRTCHGRGVRIVDRQIGHNMVQRMQMECNVCSGKGEIIPEGSRCNSCRATGYAKESKVISIEIIRGMKHNEKITFDEEGDHNIDMTPGDVVVTLKQVEHKSFTRTPDGCHISLTKEITLLEALTGFQFVVEHLDGRQLIVNSVPGRVYKDNEIVCLREEGFPLRMSATNGHMFINLKFAYPTAVDEKTKQGLIKLLGPVRANPMLRAAIKRRDQGENTMNDDEDTPAVQDISVESIDVEAEKRRYKELLKLEHGTQYDEDEEDEGPQQVGCRAQ